MIKQFKTWRLGPTNSIKCCYIGYLWCRVLVWQMSKWDIPWSHVHFMHRMSSMAHCPHSGNRWVLCWFSQCIHFIQPCVIISSVGICCGLWPCDDIQHWRTQRSSRLLVLHSSGGVRLWQQYNLGKLRHIVWTALVSNCIGIQIVMSVLS